MSSASVATRGAVSSTTTGLTRNQKRGFMAAWGGWALDGMDASIYALVLAPALADLLPRSGIAVSQGTVGYYGSILQAMFLLGWGLSMVWGPISDRIGRVRALMLTILCYSLFTFMCGLVNNIWQLAVLRVLVGLGIGGEQPVGTAYLAEELSESQRKLGAGLMHTGYYFGFFFASVANYFIGANFGWRWMFVFGGLPALLIGFIQFGVKESTKWKEKYGDGKAHNRPKMKDSFAKLFSPMDLRRTMVMSGLVLTSIIGLWAGSIYVPTATSQLAVRAGAGAAEAMKPGNFVPQPGCCRARRCSLRAHRELILSHRRRCSHRRACRSARNPERLRQLHGAGLRDRIRADRHHREVSFLRLARTTALTTS